MRRFSRRRRGGGDRPDGPTPVDAARWLGRIRDEGVLPGCRLEPIAHDDVPEHLAAMGRGEAEDGSPIVVTVSPRSAGDALLAGLATAARLNEEDGFAGTLYVVAPDWSLAARRRLGIVRAELPYTLRPLAAPKLAEREIGVEAEDAIEPVVLSLHQVAARIQDAAARALFQRATGALEGLASKHGGTLRGTAQTVELVILARRVAELRCEASSVSLVTLQPQRSVAPLTSEALAGALDGLEGQIRRRLNDRKPRDGEDGMRTRLLPLFATACAIRDIVSWPLGGSDHDEIDLVGLDGSGHPIVAAARNAVTLSGVGSFLDAVQSLRLVMPAVLAGAQPPVRLEGPRLVLAGESFSPGAVRALTGIALAHSLFEIRSERDESYSLAPIGTAEAMQSMRDRTPRRRRPGRGGRPEFETGAPETEAPVQEPERSEPREPEEEAETLELEGPGPDGSSHEARREEAGGRGRSRRRGRRRGRGRPDSDSDPEARTASQPEVREVAEPAARPRFEEVSLFDLEDGDDAPDDGAGGGGGAAGAARRRRGRGGRRGRRGGGGAESGGGRSDSREGSAGDDDGPPAGPDRAAAGPSAAPEEEEDDFAYDALSEALSELPEELEAGPAPVEVEEEEDEDEREVDQRSRERHRRSSAAKAPEVEPEPPRPPRRRAVIVARADRDSLLAAILLARDIRLLEGLWLYPQSELMGFFREVATDLNDDVPIHVVGFAPSPVIDVLQAASLYRNRISWFDHHGWAPEDDIALKQALGHDSVHHTPGTGSSLPAVLETSTRRSRFTDKLVDLATGRFTQHDFERWGRLWWWRLGEIAQKRGDVRHDVADLLTGRPSDLAKEASRAETPPIPEEVAYVSGRDFRLVHFVGYAMVVADAPEGHDLHLVGRIARERYASQLSLTYYAKGDLFLFAGEELTGRRVLDFTGLVDHLANKLDWVTALPNGDHVARFRIEGFAAHPTRLDEVIGEIAMGRSILER